MRALLNVLQGIRKKKLTAFGLLITELKTLVIVGAYLLIGCLVYILALEEPWTVVDTLYFAMVTMSTVCATPAVVDAARLSQHRTCTRHRAAGAL